MKSKHRREALVFEGAQQIADLEERRCYLREACEGDPALLQRVERLLVADEAADDFLKTLPLDLTSADAQGDRLGTDPLLADGGAKVGGFHLLQRIGEGGMGVVYMAEQTDPIRRRVAVKIVKPGMDSQQVIARFEAERQALALMDHPHIARIFDAGKTEEGRPYFVMELVRGLPIHHYCDQQKLSMNERLRLFIQVCGAVQHAHQKGVIHRDLKPSNILVTENGGGAVPKVIDFGIAKATDHRLTEKTVFTRFDQAVGTPNFMSPEQAGVSSLDVDTRSDIYSLGALLYVLLTGQNPFELGQTSWEEIRRVILERDPSKPSTRVASLSQADRSDMAQRRRSLPGHLSHQLKGDLDWIVLKAMEKDRLRRYDTASAFIADLERYLGNEPVLARPPSWGYRASKTWRRNRLAIASAMAVASAILVGAAFSVWQALEARAAEASEREQRLLAEENETLAHEAAERAAENETRAKLNEQIAKRRLYQYDLRQMADAYAQGDFAGMTSALERHWPLPWEKEDYRGLEWYHWWYMAHAGRQSVSLVKSNWYWGRDIGADLSVSPDGTQVAFVGYYLGLQLRRPPDLRATIPHHLGRAADDVQTTFSPDGRFLVSADRSRVNIYGAKDHQLVLRLPGGDKGTDRLIVFAADSSVMAAGGSHYLNSEGYTTSGGKRNVRVWRAGTWEEIAHFTTAQPIRGLALNRSGTLLSAGLENGSLAVWDLASGQRVQSLERHSAAVCELAFSPRADWLVTAGRDGMMRLWDDQFDLVRSWDLGAPVTALAFDATGRHLGVGTERGQVIRIWDSGIDGESLSEQSSVRVHSTPVWGLGFRNQGRELITLNGDGMASWWDRERRRPYRKLALAQRPASIQFGPADQSLLFLVPADGAIQRWHTQLESFLEPLPESEGLTSPRVSSDGMLYGGRTSEGAYIVRRTLTGKRRHETPPQSEGRDLLAIGNGGKRLVWDAGGSPNAIVWDVESDQALPKRLYASDLGTKPVSIFPNGTDIVVTQQKEQALVCETASVPYRFRVRIGGGRQESMNSQAVSPDGRLLAIGYGDTRIDVFDTAIGHELFSLNGHQGRVNSLAFSRDNRRLISGSDDQTVRLWDTKDGALLSTFTGHESAVLSVDISPDLNAFASLDADGNVFVWKTADEAAAEAYIDHWVRLGIEFERRDEWEDAYRVYDYGIERNPEAGELFAVLGDLSYRRRDWVRAEGAITRTLELNGHSKANLIRRGLVRGYLGKRDEAFDDFKLAIQRTQEPARPGVLSVASGALRVGKSLLPTSVPWHYTTLAPEGEWKTAPPVSTHPWQLGVPPFGAPESPSTVTEWDQTQPDLWLRQTVRIEQEVGSLLFYLRAADEVSVFVNGVEALHQENLSFEDGDPSIASGQSMVDLLIPCPAEIPLRVGDNEIAIHVHNDNLEGILDVSVYEGLGEAPFERFVESVEELAANQPRIYSHLMSYFGRVVRIPRKAARYSRLDFESRAKRFESAEAAAGYYLMADDVDNYLAMCRSMIDRGGAISPTRSKGIESHDPIFRTCVLHPEAMKVEAIREAINVYLARPPHPDRFDNGLFQQRQAVVALAQYRLGEVEEANATLAAVLPKLDHVSNYGRYPVTFAVWALVQERKGQRDAAVESIRVAEECLEWFWSKGGFPTAELLVAEAKERVGR